MERIIRRINLAYYFIYTLTILSTIIGYIITMNNPQYVGTSSQLGIILSQFVIFYIMTIPLALGLFFRFTKKLAIIEDRFAKTNKYIKAATWRLLYVGFGLVFSVIVHFIVYMHTTNFSMIYCAGISAIALLFCKPTEGKIRSDLNLEEEE